MTCLSSTRRTELLERLEKKRAQLVIIDAALDAGIEGPDAYKFDTNEGSQWLKNRSLKELNELSDTLEAQIDQITRKLNGTGLVNMNLRRRRRRCLRV
jgi:hypothetical protein